MMIFGIKRVYFLTLLLLLTLFSCTKDLTSDKNPLALARTLSVENPLEALELLNSIANPKRLGTSKYMEYIIILAQAKYNCGLDISHDCEIFKAQQYFEDRGDIPKASLAHFYAGHVDYKIGKHDKALISFIQAEYYAQKNSDHILTAKSFNNIAYIYYEQNVIDSAITYYSKAYDFLDKYRGTTNTEVYKIRVLKSLANSYSLIKEFDTANKLLNKGQDLCLKNKDERDFTTFNHLLGINYKDMGDYQLAEDYLSNALNKTKDEDEETRVFISYFKLYKLIDQPLPNIAKPYINLLIDRITTIKNKQTILGIYQLLSEYNKQIGNYEEALKYSESERATKEEIKGENQSKRLYDAQTKFYIEKKQKEFEKSVLHSIISYIYPLKDILFIILAFVLIIHFCVKLLEYNIRE